MTHDSASRKGEVSSRRAASRSFHFEGEESESSLSFVSSMGSKEDSVSKGGDSVMKERSDESESSLEGPRSERLSRSSNCRNSQIAAGNDVEMFDNDLVKEDQRDMAF